MLRGFVPWMGSPWLGFVSQALIPNNTEEIKSYGGVKERNVRAGRKGRQKLGQRKQETALRFARTGSC